MNITVTDVNETAEAGASLWETTMTVGEYGDWQGYADLPVAKGNPARYLGSATFDWDGTTYHVWHLLDSGYGNLVRIEFAADMTSDTTGTVLRVSDLDLPFDQAPIWTYTFIRWTPDNTWAVGDVLNVRLLRP